MMLLLNLLVQACAAVAESVFLGLFAQMAPQEDMKHVTVIVIHVIADLVADVTMGFSNLLFSSTFLPLS